MSARFYCCRADGPPAMPAHAVEVLLALVLDWIAQETEPPRYRGRAARSRSHLTRSEWARGMRFLLDAGMVLCEPGRFVVFVPVDFADDHVAPRAAHLHEVAAGLDLAAHLLPRSTLLECIPDVWEVDALRDLLDLDPA